MSEHREEISVPAETVSDAQILMGLRRRMAAVETMVPAAPAWAEARGEAVDTVRLRVGSRARIALAPAVLVAVIVVAVGLGMRSNSNGGGTPAPQPGAAVIYQLQPSGGQMVTTEQLETTASILRQRAHAIGMSVSVTVLPPDEVRIDVSQPSASFSEQATAIARTGSVAIVPLPVGTYGTVDHPGPVAIPTNGQAIDLSLVVLLGNGDFDPSGSRVILGPTDQWVVDFSLTESATAKFSSYTSGHVGEYFAIVLDGKVLSVPYIQSPITGGQGEISGQFTEASAKELAALLASGQLPLALKVVSLDLPTDVLSEPWYQPLPDVPRSGRTWGNSSAPVTLDIWADFRCPFCETFARTVEPPLIDDYVWSGRLRIVYHDFIVIDKGGEHESLDAANAARCAADQNKFGIFYAWLFANQSPTEKAGAFSVDRLLRIGRAAGLDMSSFEPCVREGIHASEVQAESQAAMAAGYAGAPTLLVNGKQIAFTSFSDEAYAQLEQAIRAAAGETPIPSETPTQASETPHPASTGTPAPDLTFMVYKVEAGDSMQAIASKFGVTLAQLDAANPQIDDPNHITVGQIIYIPWPIWTPPTPTPTSSVAG